MIQVMERVCMRVSASTVDPCVCVCMSVYVCVYVCVYNTCTNRCLNGSVCVTKPASASV